MVETNTSIDKAEAELLALLRGPNNKSVSVTVGNDYGRWMVVTVDVESEVRKVGQGYSFAEAWFRQKPGWQS